METKAPAKGGPSRVAIHQRLDRTISEIRHHMGGIPSVVEAESVWTALRYQDTNQSTVMAGNSLVHHQVETLLTEGRAVGNKELREYLEVLGYAAAAKWIYDQVPNPGVRVPAAKSKAKGKGATTTNGAPSPVLTLTEVRHVHELALGPVWNIGPDAPPEEEPGTFRQYDLAPLPTGMAPAPASEVPAQLRSWLRSLGSLGTRPNLIEAIADAQAGFERVHPFPDGNGRTGRLLMNLILVRFGYPPVITYRRDLARYHKALRMADQGDPGTFGEMVARAVLDSLFRFVVPSVASPRQLVPLASLATKAQPIATLRAAIERGRLRAQKGPDGQWRSSRAWVDEYLANRYRR